MAAYLGANRLGASCAKAQIIIDASFYFALFNNKPLPRKFFAIANKIAIDQAIFWANLYCLFFEDVFVFFSFDIKPKSR